MNKTASDFRFGFALTYVTLVAVLCVSTWIGYSGTSILYVGLIITALMCLFIAFAKPTRDWGTVIGIGTYMFLWVGGLLLVRPAADPYIQCLLWWLYDTALIVPLVLYHHLFN